MRLVVKVILVSLSIFLSGCMTYLSRNDYYDFAPKWLCPDNHKAIVAYRGTAFDLGLILYPTEKCHGCGCGMIVYYPFMLVAGVVDLPMSIAADTIMLPYTLPRQLAVDCNKVTSKPTDLVDKGEVKRKKIYKAKKGVSPVDKAPIVSTSNVHMETIDDPADD